MTGVWEQGFHGIPHACGGEPWVAPDEAAQRMGIPHACGGEPSEEVQAHIAATVFPTRVGVNRRGGGRRCRGRCIPHACGGEPE